MKHLLDTNICIALLKGNDPALASKVQSQDPTDFGLCSIVKAELLFGARKSKKVQSNLTLLTKFFAQFDSLPFDDRAAEHYGIIRATLESSGTPIGGNDLLIAGIALANDLVLVTRNRKEFSVVPGLRWEDW